MKNTINEIKNTSESLENRADMVEERISDLEDRNTEMFQVEEKKELSFFLMKKFFEKYAT